MIQIAENKWVNKRYVVSASLHSDGGTDTLTLSLDDSTGETGREIRGIWIRRVMADLQLIGLQGQLNELKQQANELKQEAAWLKTQT